MTRTSTRRAARFALMLAALPLGGVASANAGERTLDADGTALSVATTDTTGAGVLAHMTPLTDSEMAQAHGGFDWGGMSISFGADVQTYLDGQLALRTLVSLSANGATTQTIVGSQLSVADLASATGGGGGIAIPQMLSGSQVFFANAGRTALIQNTNGALQNVLINTMANLNALQQTNATVTLGNYAAFSAALHSGALNMGLGHEIATFSH
ncbi:MAG: hypothetical protein BGN95_09860 [Sphingomonas sp. 66-10]|jgi:hypothetical protein|uniref:hypothetical protein n=1 Tax=Sphingomonas sp. 66-10 TaxID=1895848 RepID=UPI00092BCEBE|nr:hypothetical protein [Sphingomonas sp. 66-10]OJU21979.1 MAG: hypothetical protein BGN95_09860 [Sphingomonas sp. 66-10]